MKAKHSLFLLYFSVMLIGLGHSPWASAAADLFRGRITAGVNLRAAPGLAGKVITGLEPGTVVAITGQQSGWYQIAYENDTYGYSGWVYGKYIEKLPTEPTVPATPAAVIENHPPAQVPATAPEPGATSEQRSAVENTPPPVVDMPTNTIELIQASAAPETTEAHLKAPPAATRADQTSPPAVVEAGRPVTAPPVTAVPVRNSAAVSGPGTTAAPVPGNLLGVVLKISSVFLSCLALMISYRTFQLVTASIKTAT
ncbi:MAG: SH3 domain-containing protein [Desulfobacterales bacterium]|nr:SH3 domain-containing protein [Desulfobacterales bacterium]